MKGRLLWILAGVATLVVSGMMAALVATQVASRATARPPVAAEEQPERAPGPLVALPRFVTNLAEQGTAVDVTFAVLTADARSAARVEEAKPVLRDLILGVIRSQRAVDLQGAVGKDRLAAQVFQALDGELGSGVVRKVLVTDLVTQP